MKYLLDTNVLSELRKPLPHGAVLEWFKVQPPLSCVIPSIALYEIQAGIERIRPQNESKADEIERWVDTYSRTFPVLPLEAVAARETARMIHGKSLDLLEDAMIAAIAKVNGLTVATRNTRDFELFGVSIVDPFLFPRQ